MFSAMRDTVWILVLALILCYGFFALVGAFKPSEVGGVTAGVAVLAVVWVVHATRVSRRQKAAGGRDEVSARTRERRGF